MTMKIEGPSRGTSGSRARRADRTGDAASGLDFERALKGFLAEPPDRGGGDTDTVVEAQAAGGLDGLLAVQEVGAAGDATQRRNRQTRLLRHGEDMLDRLEEVRLGLLLGAIPKDRLMELASMVRAKREQGPDRQLDALLDEIELRAEVELAKLARAEA